MQLDAKATIDIKRAKADYAIARDRASRSAKKTNATKAQAINMRNALKKKISRIEMASYQRRQQLSRPSGGFVAHVCTQACRLECLTASAESDTRLKASRSEAALYRANRASEAAEALRIQQAEERRVARQASSSAYIARREQATPHWAESDSIGAVYMQCKDIAARSGVQHDVDHIIPLAHSRVSGLNVIANLQILTASANRSKGNRFDREEEEANLLGRVKACYNLASELVA